MPWVYLVLGLAVLLVLTALIWRRSSLRTAIPCPTWLGWLVERDNPLFRNNRAAVILEHLNLQPGMTVLDYGCGPGRLTIPLAARLAPAGRVTALDIQPGMLQRVRTRAQARNLDNIDYLQAAAGQGKLPADRYDRVVLVTVLGEIPDPKAAMTEIAESLTPDGILSVTEVIADPHFQTRTAVRTAAAAAALVETARFGTALSFTLHFKKSPGTGLPWASSTSA